MNKTDYSDVSWVNKNNQYLSNQTVACFRNNTSEYLNRYYYYYYLMQSQRFREQFLQLGVGGTENQANISISDFNNIKIYKISLEEQQKIAEILSTVDYQIDDTDKLIKKTKELKKRLISIPLIYN